MRVLFADDDIIARTLLSAVLTDLGHEATSATDGDAAWAAFECEPVPLVILDINMPHRDGLAVCRLIREHPAGVDTFVLVVTARDGREDLAAVLAARSTTSPSPALPKICGRASRLPTAASSRTGRVALRSRSSPALAGSPASGKRPSRSSTRSTIRSPRCSATPSCC
jgi:CheY-like chemotaxis protein